MEGEGAKRESITVVEEDVAAPESFARFSARCGRGPADDARESVVPFRLAASLSQAMCAALGDTSRVRVFRLTTAEGTAGWLIGVLEPYTEALRFGPVTLLRFQRRRLRLFGDYCFVRGEVPVDARLLADAVDQVVLRLQGGVDVLFQALAGDSEMAGVVDGLCASKRYLSRRSYDPRPRYRLSTTLTFDAYMASLSKSTRQTFRYSMRKLRESCGGDMSVRAYESPESVDEFCRVASSVASQTYQQRELGLGFSRPDVVSRRLRLAAERGWMKSFILYCGAAPVAYIEGYLAGGVFYAYQVGYLPDWSKWSVGTVCQLEAIRHLLDEASIRPSTIDYFEGTSDYKRRLCNVETVETSIWLSTPALPNALRYLAHRQLALGYVAARRLYKAGLSLARRRASVSSVKSPSEGVPGNGTERSTEQPATSLTRWSCQV